jgi:tRNA A37 threonylcarbamoyltransferase TsaD
MNSLITVPAQEVKLNDVVKILRKQGAYRFLVIDKKYSNDNAVMDALIKAFDIKEVNINK